jgi:uncharacterized protein (TIGR00288 family)
MAPWWSRPTAEGPEEAPQADPAPREQPAAPLPPAAEKPADEPPPRPPATRPYNLPVTPPALAPGDPPPAPPGGEPSGHQIDLDATSPSLPPMPHILRHGGETDDDALDVEPAAEDEPVAEAGETPASGVAERRPRRRRAGRSRGERAAAVAATVTADPASEAVRVEAGRADPTRPAVAREPREPREPRRETRETREARETRETRETRELRERESDTFTLDVPQLQDLIREIIVAVPERPSASYEERKLALFCDLENVALGARDSGTAFDINLVLERLLEKGKIIVKKAYADWNRYVDYKRPFHEAGIELIDIPQRSYSGKNSADIKMVVDAMDISYAKEHLDTFVLLSGDSDFSPLVSKLKENDKYVIGVGVKNSSSALLIDSCDEFIYYEDIWRDVERVPKLDTLGKKEQEVYGLLVEAILALTRENKDVLWGSMIKQTMQRKRPSFNEGYYGYSTFSELLEDAERKSIVKLKKDQRSGSYIVAGFARRR